MANIPVEPRRQPTGLLIAAVLIAILAVAAVWYLTRDREAALPAETTEPSADTTPGPVGDPIDALGEAAESAAEAAQDVAGDAAEAVDEAVQGGDQ